MTACLLANLVDWLRRPRSKVRSPGPRRRGPYSGPTSRGAHGAGLTVLVLFCCCLAGTVATAEETELLPDPGGASPLLALEAGDETDAAEPADDADKAKPSEKDEQTEPPQKPDAKPPAKPGTPQPKGGKQAAGDEGGNVKPDATKPGAAKPGETGKKAGEAKPAEAPPKAGGKNKDPAPNWLKNSIDNLFRPLPSKKKDQGKKEQDGTPVQAPAAAAAKKAEVRHPSDMRAPHDPRKSESLRNATRQIRDGQWDQAFESLQKIADSSEDSMIRRDDGRWTSIREEAQRLIGTAPIERLEAYRVQYGGVAQQALAAAERKGDPAAYGPIVTRYLHTAAGQVALNRLGSAHLDHEHFGLAARCFARLWTMRAPMVREPAWRVKASLALNASGQTALAEEIMGDLALSDAAQVDLGGARRNVKLWLAAASKAAAPWSEALAEWLTMFGNPSRTGVASGGEPLLLPRWQQVTTDSQPVRAQLEFLVEDLADQKVAPLPVLFPVMVGGKIVFRTLHGVQVLDALSGKPLWESDSIPIESSLASGEVQGQRRFRARAGINMMQMQYVGGTAEYHPLCNLMFRNANFGGVSSDGQRIFVLEDPTVLSPRQPGQMWGGWDSNQENGTGASKLTAYDIGTGRPAWEAGGEAYGEPFDLPLAGYFFFGVPVADGGELFIIGEKGDEIRLFSLDPSTGRPLWSQLLAFSESKIEHDVGRRWWSAQVAIDNGVLICPTTVGWVVGIDRATRSLLWGHRITPATNTRNDLNESNSMVQSAPLKGRWAPAPPVLAGDRVIYTPLETQSVYCFDLYTGKTLWQKPRGELLYLAGVFDDKVLLVSRESVTALSLADGANRWSLKASPPSGRGVAVMDTYFLPLASGELWAIDLESGQLKQTLTPPEKTGPLGNLAMYQGMLLSLNAFGLTAFEQREAIQAEIVRRKQASPHDPWALLREAEILSLKRDAKGALRVLREISDDQLPAELAPRIRQLRMETLMTVLRADLAGDDADARIGELERLVKSPTEKMQAQRLLAERFVARKEFERAFDAYIALASGTAAVPAESGSEPGELLMLNEQSSTAVRHDVWLAGRFVDLWQEIPDVVRAALDQKLETRAALVLERTPAEQQQFLDLFAFHPASTAVQQRLVEHFAAQGDFLAAERVLARLARSTERRTAAAALERQARLMFEFKLPADAAHYYLELERLYGDVPLSPAGASAGEKPVGEPRTARQLVQALREAGQFPAESNSSPIDWHDREMRMERIGTNNFSNNSSQELTAAGSRIPFFRKHRLQVEQQEQRFEVVDAATDRLHWSLPLRSKSGSPEGMHANALVSGHHLALLHRGVLHSLSPVDHRVLWTHTLESRLGIQNFYSGHNHTPIPPMQKVNNQNFRFAANTLPSATGGSLCLSNLEFVCYHGRRSLVVLDALSGKPRWRFDGVRQGTRVFGNEQVIYLHPADGRPALALRALDGKPLDVPRLGEMLAQAVQVCGKDLVLADHTAQKLRLYDPLAGRDVWTREFPRGSYFATVDREHLAVLEVPAGNFHWVDLQTGNSRILGTLPPADWKNSVELFALADYDNVYLVVNGPRVQTFYMDALPYVRASGVLYAFDYRAGGLRWQQKLTGQNMILERLDHSPVLLFMNRKNEQQGKLRLMLTHIQAYDKFTGMKLMEETSSSPQGFRSLLINMAGHYLELRSFNERLRLMATEKVAAAEGK